MSSEFSHVLRQDVGDLKNINKTLRFRAQYSVILLFCNPDLPEYWGLYWDEQLIVV